MTNKTLLTLFGLLVAAVMIIMSMNLMKLGDANGEETFISYNNVRGAAVFHENIPYTLGFQQQTTMLSIFNGATAATDDVERQQFPVDKLIIYRFDNQPDITISFQGSRGNQLFFSTPLWNKGAPLQENSGGKLMKLLTETYSP